MTTNEQIKSAIERLKIIHNALQDQTLMLQETISQMEEIDGELPNKDVGTNLATA